MIDFTAELAALKDANLLRRLRVMTSSPAAHAELEGRAVVNFASNNYLGLADDPRVVGAAKAALDKWGAGATASRLLGGTVELHERLESELADFKNTEAAAVFPSGYHVNTGLLPALAGPDDTVVLDRYAHASLVDGARLSRATLKVFRHNDANDLEKVLKRRAGGKVWVVTESVFSMDGDVAPLSDIVGLCEKHGAHVYIDEAHATGVFGPEGRGVVNELGLEKRVDVCMGTLSKALGSQGGFVCGRRDLVEWVHNRCRTFIYSTALAPAAAAAALESIAVCRAEPQRRAKALALAKRLAGDAVTPIVPHIVGDEESALELSARFWEAGFFVPAIRPPTVPKGTARLRFSVTAGHAEADVDAVGTILKKWRSGKAVRA